VLHIYFTNEDLGRTRMSRGPNFMWEIVNSVHLLQNKEGQAVFDRWRHHTRAKAVGTSLAAHIRTLAVLSPHANYFPDFLTPAHGIGDLESSIDTVLSTPRARLDSEMTRLARDQQLPAWARRVGEGDAEALRNVGTALRGYYRSVIAPYEYQIDDVLRGEYTRRSEEFLHHGVEALLRGFEPMMRWESLALHVNYPVERDLHLDGRGLVLVPSYFCWRNPVAFADPDLTPVLVYPVDHGLRRLDTARPTGQLGHAGLAALIGARRAEVLYTLTLSRTTTQVAELVGITPATASHHTKVLRDAQLITTHRDGNTVLHAITTLGRDLLDTEL
jgi:DNA-binding transcriptional ArsR family regulator